MIRCLIIKTSSLGDIVHTLPALTDAAKALGNIEFDWVVEENFQEIPSWHPAVNRVIPVALRRWRKTLLKSLCTSLFMPPGNNQWKQFKQQIKAQHYDIIIDAQGLIKSALITRLAKGKSYGLDKNSARESLASLFYEYPLSIAKDQHAVERVRQLFAQVFGYKLTDKFDYGIKTSFAELPQNSNNSNSNSNHQILFFHGTTWETKHWPEPYWLQLANILIADNYNIILPWGNTEEKQRAQRIKNQSNKPDNITILPKMSLKEMLQKLAQVKAVVSVDTGLAHLAAALDKPLLCLFGPSNPGLTRPYTSNNSKQIHLQVDYYCRACLKKQCNKVKKIQNHEIIKPACYSSLTPEIVAKNLYRLITAT